MEGLAVDTAAAMDQDTPVADSKVLDAVHLDAAGQQVTSSAIAVQHCLRQPIH